MPQHFQLICKPIETVEVGELMENKTSVIPGGGFFLFSDLSIVSEGRERVWEQNSKVVNRGERNWQLG